MNSIERALKEMDRARVEADNELLRHIQDANRHINDHAKILNDYSFRQTLAENYKHLSTYTNLIMLGGYASIFGIWNILREQMTPTDSLFVGVMLLISVYFFAAFEVYKMISGVRATRKYHKLLDARPHLKTLAQSWEGAKVYYKNEESRFWTMQIWITVPTGFIAGGYLFYVLLRSLLFQL
jgi:hypothetical protein